MLAALALPALVPVAAHAEGAPTESIIALKYSSYRDWQPGLDRIRATAPSVYLLRPLAGEWALEGSAVQDVVSGASPRWHSAISGASVMHERRNAADAKLTRFFERGSIAVRAATSSEHDYRSNALSAEVRLSGTDNTTTWTFGAGLTHDVINPVNELVVDERKRTHELLVGVTQAWTRNDLLQLNITYAGGRGYFNDPYKLADERPRSRYQTAIALRWNHALDGEGQALRAGYRFYRDSFGVKSSTAQLEWVKPINERVSLTPLLRYYTQSAARFYFDPVYDPVIGEPFPVGVRAYFSPDARLSAFGAASAGLRIDCRLDARWSVDASYTRYAQRSSWHLGGQGSPGLAPFNAQYLQVGLSYRF